LRRLQERNPVLRRRDADAPAQQPTTISKT
jgi:hypothetical protein